MGRYGYVDVNAEGAVGGSTDFVGLTSLSRCSSVIHTTS